MKDEKDQKFSRREFAHRAAMFSATASLVPAQALVDGTLEAGPTRSELSQEPPATNLAQTPANQPKLSPESQAEADARYQQLLVLYGSRLNDDEKAMAKMLCTYLQPSLDRVRAFPLDNSAAPALYLKPLVERPKKPASGETKNAGEPAAPKKS